MELTTGFRWFGFVETQLLDGQGIAMRVTPAAVAAARDIAAMPESTDPTSGPILTVNHEGVIVLRVFKTFSVDSDLAFTVVERPAIGSVLVLDRPGDEAELVHVAANQVEGRAA